MKPISFRGFALNDNGLTSAFDRSFQRPSLSPIRVRRQGRRPLLTGVELDEWQLPNLGMGIDGNEADADALRLGLLQAFDTYAGPGALIVADDDGDNERYLYAVCQQMTQRAGDGGLIFVATLVASDDVYWRSVLPASASTTMDATPKTLSITNGGDLDTYPIIGINESVSISGSAYWRYRRFVPIKWTAEGVLEYPYELTDGAGLNTSSLASGGKLTAGNPSTLSVIVDGRHVNRWYANASGSAGGFNSTTTRIWANLDFAAGLSVTLGDTFAGGAEIVADGDISGFPPEGVLQIDDELFTYTGRDLYRQAFTGVTPAAYSTSSTTHASGATIYWIQHEVWIVYSTGAVAPTTDDSRKPVFDLLISSNETWMWENFGSLTNPNRAGQWLALAGGTGEVFTGDDHGAETDPHEVMGILRPGVGSSQAANYCAWRFYSPTGLSVIDWTGDSKRDNGFIRLQVSADGATWQNIGNAYDAAVDGTWDNFSDIMPDLSAAWRYVQVVPWNAAGNDVEAQVTNLDMTFQAALTPSSVIEPEENNYRPSVLIENLTTGESLLVELLPGLRQTAETVVVDTETKRALILPGSRNVYQHVRRDTLRPEMLRLAPGSNSIRVSESPVANNVVNFTFYERFYI